MCAAVAAWASWLRTVVVSRHATPPAAGCSGGGGGGISEAKMGRDGPRLPPCLVRSIGFNEPMKNDHLCFYSKTILYFIIIIIIII